MLSLLVFLQASPAIHPAINFDLHTLPVTREEGEAIVVRGRRAEDLKALRTEDASPPLALPRAETGFIGRSRISMDADQRILGSAPSNAVKVTVKIPF